MLLKSLCPLRCLTKLQKPMYNEPAQGGGAGMDLLGAIIATGGMLYDSHQDRKAARQNTDKTIAANKSEAELAYQRQVEQTRLQNLYNSPEEQMKRFKAGGLNPHLIYGSGGSPGQQSGIPQYAAPDQTYRYQAPKYGAAFGAILPTLMQVGTWMQNMRLGEAEIKTKQLGQDRTSQLMEYLEQANPKLLEQLDNRLSLYPNEYQRSSTLNELALGKLKDMSADYRYKYGDDLWKQSGIPGGADPIGGVRKLQFLEAQSKQKLMEAKASWSEFDITDPQAIMMLVLNGVMGLAGQTLRLAKPSGMPAGTRSGGRGAVNFDKTTKSMMRSNKDDELFERIKNRNRGSKPFVN